MRHEEVRFRVNDSQNAWLASEAKKAGIPKSKILLQLIDAAMGDHAKVNGTSDRMVGTKAMIALLENTDRTKWLNEDRQVLWFEGFIWFVGKTANGCQVQLDRWLDAPLEILEGIAHYRLTKAKDVKQALANWNELKAIEDVGLLGGRWFNDGEYFFDTHEYDSRYKDYSKYKERTLERIAKAKAAIEQPNDEIAIEVVIDAPSPPVEATQLSFIDVPEQLTSTAFRDRFEFDSSDAGNKAYGLVANAGRGADGWTAENGTKWFVSGTKKKAVWTCSLVALAESKVLSSV